jgi:protein-tyrosine phosphatase
VQEAIASRVDGRTLVADWQASRSTSTSPPGPMARWRRRAWSRGACAVATPRCAPAPALPYLRLRDRADGTVVTVAERWLPLAQGSNFRDLGGYPVADGKTVRWG